MIETCLAASSAGPSVCAPKSSKWLDRKGERGHELAMQDKALEFEASRGAADGRDRCECRCGVETGAIDALREAVMPPRAAFRRALGRRLVGQRAAGDHLLVHGAVLRGKTAAFAAAVTAGAGWGTAILHAWTEADQALWAGVLNFWFLGRVFDRLRP